LFVAAKASAQPSTVDFEVLSLRQGLFQGTVFAILQDRYGFMRFGIADGLIASTAMSPVITGRRCQSPVTDKPL